MLWFAEADSEVREEPEMETAWEQGEGVGRREQPVLGKPENVCGRRKFAWRSSRDKHNTCVASAAFTIQRVEFRDTSTQGLCHDSTESKLFTFGSECLPPGSGRSWRGTILGVHHALPPTNLQAEPGPL